MESAVNTIRGNFYRDLILEYTGRGERSFLYRYFWADGISGLLEEHFPGLSMKRTPQLKDEPLIRKKLAENLKKNPDRVADKLLKKVPKRRDRAADRPSEKASKRDYQSFWEALWLNDAGYQAGLIGEADYYLWLLEYLAAHDIYYKDTSMWDQRHCLDLLLQEGLRDEERKPGCRKRKSNTKNGVEGEILFTTAQLKKDLAELAQKLRMEHETGGAEISARLHGLKLCIGTGSAKKQADYLPWLTRLLERMALHIRIKTWLEYSGYPLVKPAAETGENDSTEPFTTGSRKKRDFSMRLFEAYCNSPRGYEIHKKNPDGNGVSNGWRMNSTGFCVLDTDQINTLQYALEKSKATSFNIPLAVDLYSGCVFFMAGKKLYEAVYRQEAEERKEAYEKAKKSKKEREQRMQCDPDHAEMLKKDLADAERDCLTAMKEYRRAAEAWNKFMNREERFCFDYLRLDETHLERFPGDMRGAFRLGPHFLENAGERSQSCELILNEFLWYCERGENSLRARARTFNRVQPADIPNPDMFFWAFDNLLL